MVTAAGSGAEAAWRVLAAGNPAGRETEIEGSACFAALLPEEYRVHPGIPRNLSHFLDRGSAIALDAALQALTSAGIGAGAGDARRFAVADGLPYRAPGQPTLFVPYGHMVARATGVRGAAVCVGGNEASGLAAVAAGCRLIAQGAADVVVTGAAQALQPRLLEHLGEENASSGESAHPFDTRHAGMVPGEAAAYLVLENEETARGRGAVPLATVAGIGEVFDSTAEPLALSDAAEAGRAMQAALGDAGYLQNQVDVVLSCADGRQAADFGEGYGLMRTFGRHAYFAGVTTVAGGLGSTLAASGPLSAAIALEAMRRQQVFPIAGFETPERDLELAYVREVRDERVDCVLVTAMGSGGTDVSLVLERSRG